MSRTYKDRPSRAKQILRNDEELSQVYIAEKRRGRSRYHNAYFHCLECTMSERHDFRGCKDCGDQMLEDLITINEDCNEK